MKPLADEIGQQEADRQDDEQPKQEAEALVGLNEAYHADTLLDVSSNDGLFQRSWAMDLTFFAEFRLISWQLKKSAIGKG